MKDVTVEIAPTEELELMRGCRPDLVAQTEQVHYSLVGRVE